jgi:pSer/pThr/pTyr-binding forkhead associated (FHA) protein
MTAKLIVTAGANRGAQFPLTDRIIFNIGSDRGSTVFLDDAKVSPNHCRLYKEDSKFTLFDVSGKGLTVNGKKVVKAVLAEGDVVQIGDTEIRFSTSDALQQAYANAAGASPAAGAPPGPASHSPGPGAPSAPPGARTEGRSVGGAPGEPRGYARVWLQCVEGNDKGKTFDLSEGNVWVIGRGHSADVTVMDIKVSRAHSRIDRVGNTFYLNDLNSTNGTFLNGQQIDRQVLHRGDYVKVGYTILSFQYEELPEPVAPPPPVSFAPPPVAAPPQPSWAPPPQPQPAPMAPPPAAAPAWAPPQPAAPTAPAPAPAWSQPPPAAPAWGAPPPQAAPASWAPPAAPAGSPAADAEADYRNRGVLNYEEVEGGDGQRAPQFDARRAGAAPPVPAFAGAPAVPGADDDVQLDISALDDDAAFGTAAPGGAAPAFAPAPTGAWAPPPAAAAGSQGQWGPPMGAPGAPPPASAWGVPAGGPGTLPPPPQRGGPAWGDPSAGAAAPWGAPAAAPYAPGGALPPPPQRQQAKTSDMMVPNLDDDADLFGGPPQGGAPAAPPAWGAPPPAAPGWGPPPAAPGAWTPPPIPQGGGERPRHKTGELPVSDYLVRGGPAPPPISSEANAPLACFLCNRPFSQDDIRQNRLRRIQDHYYCLNCVQES